MLKIELSTLIKVSMAWVTKISLLSEGLKTALLTPELYTALIIDMMSKYDK
jgi:hypothetical protein